MPAAIEPIFCKICPISDAPSCSSCPALPRKRERIESIRARLLRNSPATESVSVRWVAVARCESVCSSRAATESRAW